MADLSITASQVLKGSGAAVDKGYVAGESITAGACIYRKSSDSKWYLAQCDGTAAEAAALGIALHAASAGQPLAVQTSGPITLGAAAAPAVGTVYAVAATAGHIAPVADLVTGNYLTILGWGKTSTDMQLDINATGLQIP